MAEDKFILYARASYGVEFTYEEATAAKNAFFELYPDLLTWYERCRRDFERGYTVTAFGAYRRDLADERKARNTPVQSVASQLTQLAVVEIDKQLGLEQCVFMHDGLLMVDDEDKAEEHAVDVKYIMEHLPLEQFGMDITVPLVSEVEVGDEWH